MSYNPEEGDTLHTCKDCSRTYILTEGERDFYARMLYTLPLRCKPCRDRRKAERQAEQTRPDGPPPGTNRQLDGASVGLSRPRQPAIWESVKETASEIQAEQG